MTIPQVVRIERRWWRTQHLLPGERYLSDVARAIGRDRFLSFWTSPLPVDTALAAALKQPVGEWTEQWERRFVPRIRLGAAAPLDATALALVLAAVAVALVALRASRRQVR
jgi:AcrR family transcriptional regulator